MALTEAPAAGSPIQVHLGLNFPVQLTSRTATVNGALWDEATWQTPGRSGTGWLPDSAVARVQPSGTAVAGFDALDKDLEKYLESQGTRVGAVVYDESRGVTYSYNPDRSYFVASSIKVPIMVTLLYRCEVHKRRPTAGELALLRSMIIYSDNSAANQLYVEVGYQAGIASYLKRLGITALKVTANQPWGYSTFTPSAMVALLTRLHDGTMLSADDRSLALDLMRHVTKSQRIGVGDSSPAGATVAMKDGWITAPAPGGPAVVNSHGIVTLGAETYILSIYTDRNRTYDQGFAIVRHVAKVVGQKLTVRPAPAASPTPTTGTSAGPTSTPSS